MSIGFGVSDLVMVAQKAIEVYTACREAPSEFQDCARLCNHVCLVIESCRPDKPDSILKLQDDNAMRIFSDSCKSTLASLETQLKKYNSLGTANQKFRDMAGFAYAKSDLDKIREELKEHLLVIAAFQNGNRLPSPTSTDLELPELMFGLFILVREQQDTVKSSFSLEKEEDWTSFRDKLGAKTSLTIPYLEQRKDQIREYALRMAKEQTEKQTSAGNDGTSSRQSGQLSESGKEESDLLFVVKPAKPRGNYNPTQNPWYASIGHRFLEKCQSGFDYVFTEPPCTWRYSEEEEWLCKFPEGWARIPTLISRKSEMEQAYFYTFNGLSSEKASRTKASRAYFSLYPFTCDEHIPKLTTNKTQYDELLHPERSTYGWTQALDGLKILWMIPGANQTRTLPPSRSRWSEHFQSPSSLIPSNPLGFDQRVTINYVGFRATLNGYGLPFDLDDEVSRLLIEAMIGIIGAPIPPDDDLISNSLSEDWEFEVVLKPHGIRYINTLEKWASTVHPARFHNPDSKLSDQLPEAWDRRLDSWGNIFFVDKHTKTATRQDPRFNEKVDQTTGLPIGWRKILDHDDKPFFYKNKGKMIIGTKKPESMMTKNMTGSKHFLEREPKDGEKPVISEAGLRLRGRQYKTSKPQVSAEVSKSAPPSDSVEHKTEETPTKDVDRGTEAKASPDIGHEERIKWYTMFASALKPQQACITLEEALDQCKAFELPDDLVQEIWERSDANHDRQIDINEYANAMHEIMFTLAKQEVERAKLKVQSQQQSGDTEAVPSQLVESMKLNSPSTEGEVAQ